MRHVPAALAFAAVLVVLVAGCADGTPSAGPAATSATGSSASQIGPQASSSTRVSPQCRETADWTTRPATADGSSRDALYQVRAGAHACFDRVVFDVNGPGGVGFAVRYVPVVTADPRGDALPVAGGAVLQVVVHAPELGVDESGHQPGRILAATGDYLYPPGPLAHWNVLRAVRFAGFFEGQCTFAVGVRTRLPFRVFTMLDSRNQVREVVLDIARR